MTATRTFTDSAERVATRPRVGVLGIMQELYDDMLPGITERQGEFAASVARQLSDVAQVSFTRPARIRSWAHSDWNAR